MRYLSLSFLACLIVCIDRFHQQSPDFRQSKNLFRKRIELRFAQSLYQWCNALHGSPSGNEAVRPFLPVSLLIIGFSVFQPLEPAALLRQLLFCVCDLLKLSVQTDCFPSKAGRDSRISGARGAVPCTERSDAKQPGLPSSGLFASQSARIQGLPCIEVRP